MALTDKLTAIADGFRISRETDKKFTLDEMAVLAAEKASSVPDGTGVTFGNVEQIVVTPVPGNKAYYNAVLLPRIPEDVLAEYPYAWIRNNTQGGVYDLILSTVPFYAESASVIATGGSNSKMYKIEISTAETATEWVYNKDTTAGFGYGSDRPVLWSNHDMPNGSATATDIYFNGSDPVTSTESTIIVPAEREEAYAIASKDLNTLGAISQEIAGKTGLMTISEMVYLLNRAKFMPNGNGECTLNMASIAFETNAIGILTEG